MTSIPNGVWLASGQAATACGSALVLSLQRAYDHKTKRRQPEEGNHDHLHHDRDRDLSVPFADYDRPVRLAIETTVLTALSALNLYNCTQPFEKGQELSILASALVFVSWLYTSALAWTVRRFRLPNDWGFILNVHLCVVYLGAFINTVYEFYEYVQTAESLSWIRGVPLLISILMVFDLLYTTATTQRGQPFLDEKGRQVCGVNVSSVLGFLYFTWISPLVDVAYRKKKLHDDDLPTLPPLYRGYNLYYIFARHRERSLMYRVLRANLTALVLQIIMAIVSSLLYYVPTYFVNRILYLIQDVASGRRSSDDISDAYLNVLGQGLSIIVLGIIVGQLWYWAACSLQVRIKAMLNIEIYRKTLRRMDLSITTGDNGEEQKPGVKDKEEDDKEDEDDLTSTGQIVNLMSTDSNRISEFSTWWFSFIAAPTELFVGLFFLYHLIGYSCFLGLAVMIVTLPINHYNAKLFAKTQDALMEARDKRVNLVNEVLQGIRQIKFFASERKWQKRVMDARSVELKHLRTTYLSDIGFNLVWSGTPVLVTLVSFISYTKLQGHELTAPVAFTSIAVLNELRFALNVLPECFIEGLQMWTSIKRIQKYLDQEEIDPPSPTTAEQPTRLAFNNATVAWSKTSGSSSTPSSSLSDATRLDSDSFILKDVNLAFPANELSVICGATGTGKTLLLLSLLGESVILKGSVDCPRAPVADHVSADFDKPVVIPDEEWILEHAVAYVSQTAWLQNASIRDNILFGLPLNEKRYRETLIACALDKDLSYLEDGDLTEIGEKGITLSGGQKARVSLARAVYSRAKNVLMDDVLSAVDAHTAKHLYQRCLTGPLMQGRTRILITHHVKLCLGGCAYLVHIKGGRTDIVGTPSELRESNSLAAILDEEKDLEEVAEEETVEDVTDTEASVAAIAELMSKTPKALVEEEQRASGRVRWKNYKEYLGRMGEWGFWILLTFTVVGARMLDIADSWWIKKWTQATAPSSADGMQSSFAISSVHIPSASTFGITADKDVDFYLAIYVVIMLSNVIVCAARFIVLYFGSLRASRRLYEKLLETVLRAPMRFFDTTPVGRILNRFSKDFETIDTSVPNDLINFWIVSLLAVTSIIAVSTVIPAFVIPMLLTAVLNIAAGAMFVSLSRELKRMDSVTRSPIFSHFTETINGVSTIRAFGATRQFMQDMLKKIDRNSRPYFYTWAANRWVSLRFSLISAMINVVVALIILLNLNWIDASAAGFCFSFVLLFADHMFWTIRRYTTLEMSFNAIERVVEYAEMEQEPPAITDVRPPTGWPTAGKIQVDDLEVRYAPDLDPVLKGLSFTVNPREKIGVVGRTGSGKSTLALSFFRFVEASRGSIVIDDIDIKHLGTEDLRGNLTVIPQDPVLFSGSLRSNMDPFDQFSDDEIFTALRRVQLLPSDELDADVVDDVNANVFRDLETTVAEGGKNFSQGQRQLLCLARAILKRSKLVIMDEATASVDFKTDRAIQKAITTEFADSTILCIAHRLHTVIEYDRILVMDQGRIVEFASPLELITNTSSVFYTMCRNSGEFDNLLELAKAKHQLVEV